MRLLMERKHEFVKEYTIDEIGNVTEIASLMQKITSEKDGIKHSKGEAVVAFYRPYPPEDLSPDQKKELHENFFIRKNAFITSEEAKQIHRDFNEDPFSIFAFTPKGS